MPSPILATKLFVPVSRTRLVPRARLLEQLQTGLERGRRLTLVLAPAGYGKTTLVAAWLETAQRPYAWLSLDEADNQAERFLAYLVAALQRINPTLGQELQEGLAGSQPPDLEAFTAALINEITALDQEFILVLDDYHKIRTPTIHQAVQFLLDHQPPPMHLVIATREDPPLPVPRLRVRSQVTEIRAADLRFTVEEAGQFLSDTMGLELEPGWIAALEKRTEGWVAGLQLAALALQARPNIGEFVDSFSGSHRYVIDYLAEDVLSRQDAAMRSFLHQTSVLESLCAPLCNAVTERQDSQDFLAQLEQANLFLIPLDDRREWYRYHHLFADYLRAGLAAEVRANCHQRAARWYQSKGQVFEAVNHALATGDANLAADVIEAALQQSKAWTHGDLDTLAGWLEALPPATLQARPELSLYASRVLFLYGQIEKSENLLIQGEKSLQNQEVEQPERTKLLGLASVYHGAIAAMRGQIQAAIQQVQAGLEQLPEDAVLLRGRAVDALGMAYLLAGEVQAASQAYLQASDLGRAAGVAYLEVNALSEAAMAMILGGQLSRAEQTVRRAQQQARDPNIPPLGLTWGMLAEIALERNELETAKNYLDRGLKLSRQGGLVDDIRYQLVLRARLALIKGAYEAARADLTQAAQIVQSYGLPRAVELAAAYQAWLDLAAGNLPAGSQWAAMYRQQRAEQAVEYLREFEDLTLARVQLAEGAPEQALEILVEVQAAAEAAGRLRTVLETHLLEAQAHQLTGQAQAAVDGLAQAMQLAAPERFVRLFLDEGPALFSLLPEAHGAAPEFARLLLAELAKEAEAPGAPTAPGEADPLIEPLTDQEQEVLGLLSTGMSNQEIAEALVISVGTAKWHLHNIYSKLGVSSRTQAVAQAQKLGLL